MTEAPKLAGFQANAPTIKKTRLEPDAEPMKGDLRIVEERKHTERRYRVDWFGTVSRNPAHFGKDKPNPIIGWRVAEAYGDEGYFPTLRLAQEAIEGPVVHAVYRPEPPPLTGSGTDDLKGLHAFATSIANEVEVKWTDPDPFETVKNEHGDDLEIRYPYGEGHAPAGVAFRESFPKHATYSYTVLVRLPWWRSTLLHYQTETPMAALARALADTAGFGRRALVFNGRLTRSQLRLAAPVEDWKG